MMQRDHGEVKPTGSLFGSVNLPVNNRPIKSRKSKAELSDRSEKISALGGGANGYPERYGSVACQSWHRGNPGVRELLAFQE